MKFTLKIALLGLIVCFGLIAGVHAVNAISIPTETQCSDAIDNDGDLLTDLSDPDCAVEVVVEENTAETCSDAVDNDEDLLTDLSDPDCAAFVVVPEEEPVDEEPSEASENTAETCSDAADNDGDLLTDLSDPDCAAFVVVPEEETSEDPSEGSENTAETCSDAVDNDEDLLTDLSDPDCAEFSSPEEIETPTEEEDNSSSRRSSNRRGGGGSSSSSVPSDESVLGASIDTTSCSMYLTTYMRMGQANDVEEVKKLQKFLNDFMGSNLPVTGFFGSLTDAAVKNLQTKYAAEILQPWIDAGVVSTLEATGYVFKTTQYFINTKMCTTLNLQAPVLK